LLEYASSEFPNHRLELVDEDFALTDHAVIALVTGAPEGVDVLESIRHVSEPARVAAVFVRPSEPSVVPSSDEDKDGDADVPPRRVGAAIVIGSLIGAAVGAIVALIVDSSNAALYIVAIAVGLVLGFLGGTIVGSGRFAGQRATTQPHVPGQYVALVAALATSEDDATRIARSMDTLEPETVRIVGADGLWHAPNT
jgi:hypothetical protein